MTSKQRTSNYLWVILALFFFLQTASSMAVFAFGPLAPFLQENLGITRAQIGMFSSAIYTGMLTFSTHAGWLTDKYGTRLFLVAGPISMGVLFITFALSRSFVISILIIFLSGLGYQFINPATVKGLVLWFPHNLRATAIGLKQAGVSFGGVLVAAILPLLIAYFSWQGGITFIGIVIIFSALISGLFYREPLHNAPLKEESTGSGLRGIRHILTNRNLMLAGGSGVMYGASATAFHTYLILYLNESFYVPIALAGFLLAIAQLGVVAGRILWGIISDRIFGGKRKTPIIMIGFSIAIMSIITMFGLPSSPYWLMYIILLVFGFSLGFNGIYLTFMAELGRGMTATSAGFGASIVAFGMVFGTPIFGYIADKTASYNPAWMYMALLGILGGVMAFFICEEKRI